MKEQFTGVLANGKDELAVLFEGIDWAKLEADLLASLRADEKMGQVIKFPLAKRKSRISATVCTKVSA